jgi:peroxiredoxin
MAPSVRGFRLKFFVHSSPLRAVRNKIVTRYGLVKDVLYFHLLSRKMKQKHKLTIFPLLANSQRKVKKKLHIVDMNNPGNSFSDECVRL